MDSKEIYNFKDGSFEPDYLLFLINKNFEFDLSVIHWSLKGASCGT